jgi:hypothetical protein
MISWVWTVEKIFSWDLLVNLSLWGGNEWGLREKDETHTSKDIIATLEIITNTPPPWTGVYHVRVE